MAAPKIQSPAEFRQRCIELAEAHHMLHTPRLIGNRSGELTFTCPSEARDGYYTVRISQHGSPVCTCKSYGACKHIGACLVACDLLTGATRVRTAAELAREEYWQAVFAGMEG